FDNKEGSVLFKLANDEFSRTNEDIVVGFLKAIDSWASEYSGKGADVFQTKTVRITFERSAEFNLTFACCTDLSSPMEKDKEKLEEIKYAFVHQFWETFTSNKRHQLLEQERSKFVALVAAFS
ncbi:MAG: hypothetical protein GYA24_01545, partial [Candidatus Lokiarchaeota archaeon]|nr:hypothetical protein [Candidatus Lokiarchaeota archaeon]